MDMLTFRTIPINEPFTIYKKVSNKRYEAKQAIAISYYDGKNLEIRFLDKNGKIIPDRMFADTSLWITSDGFDETLWDGCYWKYYLNKPEDAIIFKKRTIIEIIDK